jgi:hypothetical protein
VPDPFVKFFFFLFIPFLFFLSILLSFSPFLFDFLSLFVLLLLFHPCFISIFQLIWFPLAYPTYLELKGLVVGSKQAAGEWY